MKRAGFWVLAGVVALGCKPNAPSKPRSAPWQWRLLGAEPSSAAAGPALLVCEANGTGCAPAPAALPLTGSKLVRLLRGAARFELDAATQLEIAQGSELLVQDAPRSLELRAGSVLLSREATIPGAGTLQLELLDRTFELRGRASLVARLESENQGQVFVTRGLVQATGPLGPREFHPGQGALLQRQQPDDLHALFSGKMSHVRQTLLASAPLPTTPQSASEPRGLGTMTARVRRTTAIVGGVRLAEHHVRAVVRDGVAQTEVEEVFRNDTNQVLEGRYLFPLPADATISGLTLFVGDQPVDGELVERKRASAIFSGIVDEPVKVPWDPALLQWLRGSEFSLKVFPIPAKGQRKVILRYQQTLTSDGPSQAYVYPLSLGAERRTAIDELSIDVELSDGGEAVRDVLASGYPATVSPQPRATHVAFRASASAPDRDFVVSYRRAAPEATVGTVEQGFVAMRLRAALPPGAPLPAFRARDRVLVLDASHSQSAASFAAVQQLAVATVQSLEPNERFAILFCNSACEAFPPSGLSAPTAAALADAQAFIAKRQPAGASDLAGGLRAAAERVPAGASAQVVYVGDGAPSAGELSVPSISHWVRPSFAQRTIDLRLFGVGKSLDELTLRALARELSGSYDSVSSPSSTALVEQTERLVSGLRTPLLLAPTLELPEAVSALEPRVLPNLRLGEEIMVIGKYAASLPFDVTLKGQLNGEPYALVRHVALASSGGSLPFAARSWAEARIRELSTTGDPNARREVIELSKRFRVMSRETSWLVLESEAMFAEFGIPRQRGPDGSQAWGGEPRAASQSDSIRRDQRPSTDLTNIDSTGPAAPSGVVSRIAGPKGNARIGTLEFSGGAVANAARVVAGMRAGFRSCYQRGLAENPDALGFIRLVISVARDGQVLSVSSAASSGFPLSIVRCVETRARAAQFDAPDAGLPSIVAPVTFIHQDAPDPGPVPDALVPIAPLVDVALSRPGDQHWTQAGDAALDQLQAELAASPGSRRRHEAVVRGLLLRGRFAPALAAAERFVQLDPELAQARELLSYAAVASGDRARAVSALDELTESAARDISAHSRAARAFEALGDEVRACAHWRTLFELTPNSDSARFEALRCRARVLNDRAAVLIDAHALAQPGPLLQRLLRLLDAEAMPAFGQSSGGAGQFEATLSCEPSADCPSLLVLTPTGTVISPWTPAAERSSATSLAFSGLTTGPYRVLLVGGASTAQGQVKVRALDAWNTFSFAPGHAPTIATTQVTLVRQRAFAF